jgi:hypothetical protein
MCSRAYSERISCYSMARSDCSSECGGARAMHLADGAVSETPMHGHRPFMTKNAFGGVAHQSWRTEPC